MLLVPAFPVLTSLQRTADHSRQQLQPQDPKDLHFDLQMEHISDGFFCVDVKIRGRRHLVAGFRHNVKQKTARLQSTQSSML